MSSGSQTVTEFAAWSITEYQSWDSITAPQGTKMQQLSKE